MPLLSRRRKVLAALAERLAKQGIQGIRSHSRRAAAPSSSPADTRTDSSEQRFFDKLKNAVTFPPFNGGKVLAARVRRTSVLPQAKPRRRGGSAAPSIEIPKGGAGPRPAESTKKDTTYVVSFLGEGTVKMDIWGEQNRCRKTTRRPFWAAARVRRTSVLPQAKPRRRGGSAAPSIEIPKGGAGPRPAESTKKDTTYVVSFFVVREAGVEPARPCEHWHLKPASLPIPPLAQVGLFLCIAQNE